MVKHRATGREEPLPPEPFLGVVGDDERARPLADWLGCAHHSTPPEEPGWIVRVGPDAALLHTTRRQHPVRADFLDPAFQRRLARATPKSERLARAVGLPGRAGLRVLDATAGLGRDAALLAHLGAQVQGVERNRVVYTLLDDGVRRWAATEPDSGAQRLRVAWGEAVDAALTDVDVVYLDPMFAAAQHRHAAGRETAALRALVQEKVDEAQLARCLPGPVRVVVKRPRKAAPLDGRPPHHSLPGRTIRFDVYEP